MEYGSEFEYAANAPFLKEGDSGFIRGDWQLFRSGRDAIRALVRLSGRKKALLPALCCESMVQPFLSCGCSVEFYKLREDLSADEGDVLSKLEKGSILLYMSYFGQPAFSDDALTELRCKGEDILFVEDRTQDILTPLEEGAFRPEAMLSSLRKWTALPEGAVLRCDLGEYPCGPSPEFGLIRKAAMEKKDRYLESWDIKLKEEFLHELALANELLDRDTEPAAMSPEQEKLLRRIDFDGIFKRRRENLCLLRELIRPLEAAGKLRMLTEKPELSCLYLPIWLEDRDRVQQYMFSKKIYAPLIWPQPEQAAGICHHSDAAVRHMMGLICDQRYGEEDMRFIAKTLGEILA